MKKLYFLFITFMVCSLSFGQILSDDFNYTDGALLTANGWTVSSAGTNSMDVGASNGLTYTDYSGTTGFTGVVVGNAVKVDNTGEDLTKSFAADVTSGTLYYSFLLNVTDATAGYFTMVGKGTAFAARVFVKPSATAGKFNIGLSNSSTAAYATTPTDFNLNTTYLVIVKYDVTATGTASIWVKSTGVPATELAAGTPEHTASGNGTAVIAGVFLRQYAATQNLTIDGIRVYSTWFGETPCALTLLAETKACAVTTYGIDAYTATIPFTGGNTASYTLSTSNGTISGDNPSTTAAGNIIITGVNEGTNITLSISGGCTISRTITAPECKPVNTLPYYEGFNYTAGNSLGVEQMWTNVNTGDNITTTTGSLSYTGLTTAGNSVSFAADGFDCFSPITSTNTGTVYYSFLMNIGSMTGVTDANGGYFAGIGENSTTLGATLWTKRVDDTNFNLGIEVRTATTTNTTYSTASYQTGQTYFVVVGYTFNTGTAADDVVSLWVNPSVNAAMPTATLTDSHTGTDLLNASTFFLRQDSATETPTVQVDELRIGTAWADVVPQTAGINDNNINGLTMYPNPLSGNTLYLTSTANAAMSVQIFDLLGKEVLKANVVNNAVNVAKLTAGVYVVKITEEGKTATRKLVIQ